MKIDYAFKAKVLNEHEDLLKRYNQSSKYEYAKQLFYENGIYLDNILDNHSYNSMYDLFNECSENGLLKEFNECRKILNSKYKNSKRLSDYVASMLLDGDCLFLTLTFTDSVLSSTKKETRKKYVLRFLEKYNAKYVANIDYGKTNHREHYHCLIQVSKVNKDDWTCGSIIFQRVRNRNIANDSKRLGKYIAKLSNHAVKETTHRSALMYSRELRA